MTFQEIFSSNFIDSVNAVSVVDMSLALALAFADGLFIFFIYKKTFSGVMYSASFGISLIAMTMITALVILAISSNVVLSLGMVGALSIVRFRTAGQDPLDSVFLCWGIAPGVVLPPGLLLLAVAGSIFIGIVLLIFSEKKTFDRPYILVIHCVDSDSEERSLKLVEEMAGKVSLKSKTVTPGSIELNYEVRLRDGNTDFVNRLAEMDGVTSTVMVSYNGDYMG